MRTLYQYFFSIIIVFLWSVSVNAQTLKLNFSLSTNESGIIRNYQAKDWIHMQIGFKYTATTSATFRAWINPNLTIPVTSISNPQPGDTTGMSTDGIYVPGSTFGTDPLTGISGLATSEMTTTGSTGTTGDNSVSDIVTYTYPILWFKTVPITNNLNGAYTWKDITGNNAKLLKYSTLGVGNGDEYQIKRDTMRTYNFNPSIYLPGENISKEILINKSNLSQTTIIGVWGVKEDLDKNNFIFAIDGRRKEGSVFTKQWIAEGDSTKSVFTYGNDTLRSLVYNPVNKLEKDPGYFQEHSLRIATYSRANKPGNSLWGETPKAVVTLGGKLENTNVNSTSTYIDNIYQQDAFKGFSPELLVFDRQLSTSECNRFETYLAIKYGITLDRSYISPHGDVIWNYVTNQNYNNRITGYGREDEIGLDQKMSTTSYEEAPYYSNQTTFDSFDGNDSYNSSSRYRLLVMGYQPGNTPCNRSYILFGDNNDSLKFISSQANGVAKQLKRQWVLNTNQPSFPVASQLLQWDTRSTLTIPSSGYIADIVKSGFTTTLWAVTQDTLKGKDGYFAWTVGEQPGPVVVKFGSNQANVMQGSHDYGYIIDSIGRVFTIVKGSTGSNSLFNIEAGQRIEVEKNDQALYLRVNGVRYKKTEIAINQTDYGKTYYGAISIGSNPSEVKLTGFRHGGFVDTGNKIELSYLRIPELAAYYNKQTYLIVDRSGTGNFNAISDVYACDEWDTNRSKIIFNNIFWDTDGNGKDAFTFGYKASQSNRAKSFSVPEPINIPESFAILQIYYPNKNDLTQITVKSQTLNPIPSTIALVDMLGRIIFRKELPASNTIQYTTIKLPSSGVYVVKVLNAVTQYSQKVISEK